MAFQSGAKDLWPGREEARVRYYNNRQGFDNTRGRGTRWLARRAYKMALMYRPEMKSLLRTWTSVAIPLFASFTTTGNMDLTNLAQGDDHDDRIGDVVRLRMLQLRCYVQCIEPGTMTADHFVTHYRIMVIQWFDNEQNGVLNGFDVLDETAGAGATHGVINPILAPLRPVDVANTAEIRTRRWHVLYDRIGELRPHLQPMGEDAHVFDIKLKLNILLKYIASTAVLASQANPINLFFFSSTSNVDVTYPYCQLSVVRRMWYYDA